MGKERRFGKHKGVGRGIRRKVKCGSEVIGVERVQKEQATRKVHGKVAVWMG